MTHAPSCGAASSGVRRHSPDLRPSVVIHTTFPPPGNLRPSRPPVARSSALCSTVVVRSRLPQTASYARLFMMGRYRLPAYGTMYVMKRTTVYLPDELKARLEAEAKRRGTTEAQIVREAVDKETRRPRPRGGIISGGELDARDIDSTDTFKGFGED